MIAQDYIQSGAIEACILGTATVAEMEEYYTMRQNSPAVLAYADAFEQSLEQLYLQDQIAPAANTKTLVLNSINQPFNEAKVVSMATHTRKTNKWQIAAIAAVALFLASTVTNFMLMNKLKNQQANNPTSGETPAKNNGDLSFLKNPDIVPVTLNGVGYHAICRCSLFWDKRNKKAYFQIHHLVPPGEDKGYQLWAYVAGKAVSVGMIPYNTNKEPVSMANVPDGATGFAVTQEKAVVGAAQPNPDTFLKGEI